MNKADQNDLEDNTKAVYWAFRGWLMGRRVYYTEMWERAWEFLEEWNAGIESGDKCSGMKETTFTTEAFDVFCKQVEAARDAGVKLELRPTTWAYPVPADRKMGKRKT